MRVCPECGAEVSASMKFCAECGTKLDTGQSTVSFAPSFGEEGEPVISGGAEGAALIELDQVEGTAGRRMHDLGDEVVTVGRGQESSIFLDDVTVSRKHAEIVHGNSGYRIRDVGSLNGTYVNRVRVDAVDLRNGDEIQVGKYRFRFVFA
ncbi:MAG TPA: FHA domain-containing protein [Rubrobacter sp.]|nr:FHA domain-containing protein [Rubrobacter sp.]